MAESWKEASINSIRVSQTLIARTEEDIANKRRSDPLPLLRDACVRESNNRIHNYARKTRSVVIKLRQALAATNEEIKCQNRVKLLLERGLENTRKDIVLNVQTSHLRKERPLREKSIPDNADGLIETECQQLLKHKTTLEMQLKQVLQQLQVLNAIRSHICSVMQERSRVTELLCHSISSSTHNEDLPKLTPRHVQSLSAPPLMTNDLPSTGPLEPLTPAAATALLTSEEVIKNSALLRKESCKLLDQVKQQQCTAHDAVNSALIQKISQTVTLAQHLEVNSGETKLAINKVSRQGKQQEKSLGYIQGPVSSSDVAVREKLDRPMVAVFQKHPGTDLPEAAQLVKASEIYADSIAVTQRNMALLKLARKKLKDDIRDKRMAMDLDSSAVRLRRRKADHRWVVHGNGLKIHQLKMST